MNNEFSDEDASRLHEMSASVLKFESNVTSLPLESETRSIHVPFATFNALPSPPETERFEYAQAVEERERAFIPVMRYTFPEAFCLKRMSGWSTSAERS